MCNLFSMTNNREAIIRLLRISENRAVKFEPQDPIFPAAYISVVHSGAERKNLLAALPHSPLRATHPNCRSGVVFVHQHGQAKHR